MKSKKLIAVILLIILIIAQFSFIKISKAQTGNVEDIIDIPVVTDVDAKKFHYNQLSDLGKSIYDGIDYMRSRNYFLKQGKSFDLAEGENPYISQEQLKEYMKGNAEIKIAMNAARYAFYADHPEVFYVNFQNLSLRVTQDANGKYHANLGSGNLKTYYVDGFENKDDVNAASTELEAKVTEIVNGANAITQEDDKNLIAEKIKYVHNKIIKDAGYRLESDCTEGNEGFISTPYGALVKGEAVCEGYARALKTVLDRLDIPCILVQGIHQSEGSAAVPHMWNYVQIEKETEAGITEKVWYAVDATLDDPFIRKHTNNEEGTLDPGADIVEGFENTKYLLVGTETMFREHTPIETVEAAGNYIFTYPDLNSGDYNDTDIVTNKNGLLVKYKQNGVETEEYTAGAYSVSYNEKGWGEASKEGKYLIIRYYEKNGEEFEASKWAYLNPISYAGGFVDLGDCIYLIIPNGEYIEFGVTTLKPTEHSSSGVNDLTYQGDGSDIIVQSGRLHNINGTYIGKPYIKTQSPKPYGNFTVGNTYNVDVTYDDDLVPIEEDALPGYKLEIKRVNGSTEIIDGSNGNNGIITDFQFDGTRRVTFKLTPSKMYADDGAAYRIYLTGLVGKKSRKAPLEISYLAMNQISCAYRMNKAKNWNVFGTPFLIENEDLSMNGWETSSGEAVSDKLKSRIALVTTKTTNAEAATMTNLMQNKLGEQELIASETYKISLNVCKQYVVKTGHRLQVAVGFPAGYGPNDTGVTFKAYHFMKDASGNVTGVEEIPCIVTGYGLIIMCDSFSPFAVAVVEDAEAANKTEKSVILSATEGGTIKSISTAKARANAEDSNYSDTMFMLKEGEEKVINIKANDGYVLESLTVGGRVQDLSNIENRKDINAKITYDSIQGTSGIVEATFVADSVVKEEEARNETVVTQVVSKPVVIIPEKKNLNVGENLTIIPEVTAEADTVNYQWYKNGVALNGKTAETLVIENITADDFGRYTLKVTAMTGTIVEETISSECIVYKGTFNAVVEKAEADTDLANLQLGEEFAVNLKVSGIDQEGIIALEGKLEYDSNVLQYVAVTGPDGWTVDEDSIDKTNFRFVTNNSQIVTGDTTIFRITFRVKNTVSATTQSNISIKEVTASGGYGVLSAEDSSTPITVIVPVRDVTSDKYIIDEENLEISGIRPGKGTGETAIKATTVQEFIEKINTARSIEIYDNNNTKIDEEDYETEIIKTGYTAKIGEKAYSLVVSGDIDKDGKITTNDLAKTKLHIIANKNSDRDRDLILLGIYKKAADLDKDGNITVNDLAKLQLALIGVAPIK